MWLVPVKIKGNSPIKLFKTMKINNPKKKIVLPLDAPGPKRVLTSLCNVDLIELKIKELLLGNNQKILGIRMKGIIKLSQLEVNRIDEEGSNLENRLFIMFIYRKRSCY